MLEIYGAIFIIALGTIGHFIYDWTNHDPVSAVFFATNESTWEHMKLTVYPSLIWFFLCIFLYRGNPNLLPAQALSMITMMLMIPLFFYSYTLFTHKSFLSVDILCFCVSIAVGMWVFHLVINAPALTGSLSVAVSVGSVVLIVAIFAAYIHLTYHPRHNFLFRDPITGRYGLAGHPCMHEHKHNQAGSRQSALSHHNGAHRRGAYLGCADENIEFLRRSNKVLFVAMKTELDADLTSIPVIYTGVGKARTSRALLKYIFENQALLASDEAPVIVSLGTAGSGRHNKSSIVLVDNFVNNGDSFIREKISFDTFPEPTGHICASSDFFVGPENFTENEINRMRDEYDCMDMESFALASICKELGLKFCAVKCISDGADAPVQNFDAELPKFRAVLNSFVKTIE